MEKRHVAAEGEKVEDLSVNVSAGGEATKRGGRLLLVEEEEEEEEEVRGV